MQLKTAGRAMFGMSIVIGGLIAGVACNLDGSYSDPGFSSSSGGFSGSSSGTSSRFDAGNPTARTSACERATENGSCTGASPDECEVGDDPNPKCNTRLFCRSRKWEVEEPPAACAHECPRNFVAERDGGCEGPNAGTLRCEYQDEGFTCGCAPFYSDAGVIDGGNNGTPSDAGDAGKKPGRIPAGYTWQCVKPAAGCPRQRPRLGEACVKPLSCDYGRCVFEDGEEDGLELRCYGRTWERQTGTYCQ